MKRCINNLWLISTVALFTACEKGTPQMSDSGDAISFGIEWAQDSDEAWSTAKSRASQTDETTITDFGVFTYYEEGGEFNSLTSTPNYMNNIEVSKDGSDWIYAPIMYWPPTGTLSFFAYSPYEPNRLTYEATAGKPQFTYSLPNKVTSQQDLLVSTPAINKTKAELTGDKKTLITFHHALACLDLTGSVAGVMSDPIKITNVEITGLSREGTFSIDNDYNLQTSGQAEAITYTLTAANDALNEVDLKAVLETQTPKVSILTQSGYPMIIPQTVSAGAQIAVTITSGNPATEEVVTKNLSALIGEFESGMRYTINIKMASLVDVTITATVQPWKEATVNVPSFN